MGYRRLLVSSPISGLAFTAGVVRKISLGASRIGSLIRRVIKEMYDRNRYE
jgi:hypothetical protein